MSGLSALQDVHARRGLGAVGSLLQKRACCIAYIGNSVSAQRRGYRARLHQRLVAHFGQPHRMVNAGLGGVGAIGSLFTLPDLVLPHAPDLCLIDCSLGDIGTKPPPESIGPVLEGMLRKLIHAGCAVVLLHFFKAGQCFDESNPVIKEYERVAAHYGVASINVARSLECAIVAGPYEVDELFSDGVHTTERGSEILADLLAEAVVALCGMPPVDDLAARPTPLHRDHYEFARLVRPDQALVEKPDGCRPERFRLLYPYLQVQPGNEIRFGPSSGSVKGLLLVLGPHSGFISVRMGAEQAEYLTWDQWCDRERLHTFVFPRALPHGIELGVTALEKEVPGVACDGDHERAAPRKVLKLAGILLNETDAAAAAPQPMLRQG